MGSVRSWSLEPLRFEQPLMGITAGAGALEQGAVLGDLQILVPGLVELVQAVRFVAAEGLGHSRDPEGMHAQHAQDLRAEGQGDV
jgi:hypothetical protein